MSSHSASREQYEWPSLADEGKEMIACAVLMYGLADLRSLARKGKLTKGCPAVNERILKLPATDNDILETASANEDVLAATFGQDQLDMYGKALMTFTSIERGSSMSPRVVYFDDDNSMNQLVYGIEVNDIRKRITVGFRGSVTVKDFMVDGKAHLCELPNPAEPNSGNTIGIHHGFYEYLFGSAKSGKARTNGDTSSKCEVITGQVAALLEKNPGYRLYVTGHSLGAALAVLYAAHAATSGDPRILKPVSVICIACPKIGNRDFRRAFKTLENQGSIRCLRIQNYKDAVTFLPDRARSFRTCDVCERYFYAHVGLQLTLNKDGGHEFAYPKDDGGKWERLMKNWTWHFGHDLGVLVTMPVVVWYNREFLLYHSCSEYARRFEKFSEVNGDLYLNDVYRTDVPDCDSDFGI